MASQCSQDGPQLLIEPVGTRAAAEAGHWRVVWRIQNVGRYPLQLLAAWLPHSRFRNEEETLTPPLDVATGASVLVELPVRASEAPGAAVENCFLILRVLWQGQLWRAFARHCVVFDKRGFPQPICELITVHPVGFSAQGRDRGNGPV